MELGVGFLQEVHDYVGSLESVRGFAGNRVRGGSALLRIGGTAEAAVATWFLLAFLLALKDEAGIFLIAFGREANVVEQNFIGAGLGHEPGEGDVVILNLGVGRVGPDQLAVLAPGLAGLFRFHREFG